MHYKIDHKYMAESTQSPEDAAKQAKTEDLRKRVEGFNGELIPLLGKYKVGLAAMPFITTDGRILARPHIIDDSESEAEAKAAPAVEDKKESGLSEA